ncbi:hypothetical protein H5410_059201 [Solanum commersonii]|uniref:F-box domain-containing protein n=1 Tax=Solanum commersonii TaxID=4109 RepID=A0A9J5W1P8_SOLCO|nr:hypothetical protein H5410_059201 [Solanum commersonii]
MGSRWEQLPDGVSSEILRKTKCAKSLVRCAKLSTKLEPLVLNVRVHTLYLPIIIIHKFEVPVPFVPPSNNSNMGLFQIIWLFIKLPFSVCISLLIWNGSTGMREEMTGHDGDTFEFRGRAAMGSLLEQLPDVVISEIFGKTKCAKFLVRCAKLSTKLEPLVLDVRVRTLYLPIIIRQI